MKRIAGALSRHLTGLRKKRTPRSVGASDLITPLHEAVEEIRRRNSDPELRRRVEEYLKGDIPEHFSSPPVLYLARHVATPNFETLCFLHLVEPLELKTVIGQDLKDKFVPKNQLKKALGKLSVSTGMSKVDGVFVEQFENVRIVDFNKHSGEQFHTIETEWGEKLSDFHKRLFSELTKREVVVVDDSDWIDRQHRGKLLAHYKKFLALFIVHGILFEDYAVDDAEERKFVRRVLRPAFRHIEKTFGHKPLIAQLTPTSVESAGYWISYPTQALQVLKNSRGAPPGHSNT